MISDYEKELRELNAEIEKLTAKKNEITDKIKSEFVGNVSEKFGGIQITISPAHYELVFDSKTFEKDHPEIVENYLKCEFKDKVLRIVLESEKE